MYRIKTTIGFVLAGLLLAPAAGLLAGGQEEAAGAAAGAVPPGYFGTYEPAIDMEWIKSTWQGAREAVNNKLNPATGETFEDNRWTRAMRDELGINVTYKWVADGSQAQEKLKLAMASGDLPDVITLEGAQRLVDFQQLAEADLLADVTDLWEQYAAPLTKEVVGADGQVIFDAVSYDGRMMGIPGPSAGLDTFSYFWVRQDWLDNLGLAPPRTTAELMEMARAFTHDDPDGNGEDDTFAMMLDKSLWYRSEGFFWSFGAYPDTWLEAPGGGLTYGALQPEVKDALAALRAMHADGQLDPEWAVKDGAKANEAFARNAVGIAYGGHWISYDFLPGWENDDSIDWSVYPQPGVDGTPPKGELELGMQRIYAVRKEYEHPEALLKAYNLYWEKLYGDTGDYEYWGNDEHMDGIWWIGPFAAFHPWVNIPPYYDIQAVYAGTKDPAELTGVSLDYYNNTENNPHPAQQWAWQEMFSDPATSPFGHITRRVDEGSLFIDNFVGAPTPTMTDRWGTLEELKITTFTRIIVGDLDLDSGFAEFVEDWQKLGGDRITQEVSDWYRAGR